MKKSSDLVKKAQNLQFFGGGIGKDPLYPLPALIIMQFVSQKNPAQICNIYISQVQIVLQTLNVCYYNFGKQGVQGFQIWHWQDKAKTKQRQRLRHRRNQRCASNIHRMLYFWRRKNRVFRDIRYGISTKTFHKNFPPKLFFYQTFSICLLIFWIFEFCTVYLV